MRPIRLKSLEEVLERFRELVRRHRRRFLNRNLRPCPNNCKFADVVGHKVVGCTNCGSHNPEFCKKHEKFVPLYSKEELAEQFKHALYDPQLLLKEYRDLVVFLWVLGQFDSDEVPQQIFEKVEKREAAQPGGNPSSPHSGSIDDGNQRHAERSNPETENHNTRSASGQHGTGKV